MKRGYLTIYEEGVIFVKNGKPLPIRRKKEMQRADPANLPDGFKLIPDTLYYYINKDGVVMSCAYSVPKEKKPGKDGYINVIKSSGKISAVYMPKLIRELFTPPPVKRRRGK